MTDIIQTNISKLQKLTKYILMGLIVILATKYIPDNKLLLYHFGYQQFKNKWEKVILN